MLNVFAHINILYTYSIVIAFKTHLMDFLLQAHVFLSTSLGIFKSYILSDSNRNFLDDTVQGYYANQLKLIVLLPARNKRYYNRLCDKRLIK